MKPTVKHLASFLEASDFTYEGDCGTYSLAPTELEALANILLTAAGLQALGLTFDESATVLDRNRARDLDALRRKRDLELAEFEERNRADFRKGVENIRNRYAELGVADE